MSEKVRLSDSSFASQKVPKKYGPTFSFENRTSSISALEYTFWRKYLPFRRDPPSTRPAQRPWVVSIEETVLLTEGWETPLFDRGRRLFTPRTGKEVDSTETC